MERTESALFVGVSRLSRSSFNATELPSAALDAQKMLALFQDNARGSFELVVDEGATSSTCRHKLQELCANHKNGGLLLYFAGHLVVQALPTEERVGLACHDFNADQSDVSGVYWLKDLLEDCKLLQDVWILLDCCSSKSLESVIQQCKSFVWVGASGNEHAYEYCPGGGVFTDTFVNVSLGKAAIKDPPYLQLCMSKTLRTISSNLLAQTVRTPSPSSAVPSFRAGASMQTFLSQIRVDKRMLDALLHQYLFSKRHSLKSFQDEILKEVLTVDSKQWKNRLICAGTGEGKTFCALIRICATLSMKGRVVILCSLKALANQYYGLLQEYTKPHFPLSRIVLCTGDFPDQDSSASFLRFDVCVMTYEMFYSIMSSNMNFLGGLSLVVADEFVLIGIKERGKIVDVVLTKIMEKSTVQKLLLSGMLETSTSLIRWLESKEFVVSITPSSERRIISEYVFDIVSPKVAKSLNPSIPSISMNPGNTPVLNAIFKWKIRVHDVAIRSAKIIVSLLAQKKGPILFVVGRIADIFPIVEATLECFAHLSAGEHAPFYNSLIKGYLRIKDPQCATIAGTAMTPYGEAMTKSVKYGIGTHCADMTMHEREWVESLLDMKHDGLKAVVCTTSLAEGVNTSTSVVVLDEMLLQDSSFFPVSKYLNFIGRAGRPGHIDPPVARSKFTSDSFYSAGHAIMAVTGKDKKEHYLNSYHDQPPEPVVASSLSTMSDQTRFVGLLLSAFDVDRVSIDSLEAAFKSTFGFHCCSKDDMFRDVLMEMKKQCLVDEKQDRVCLTSIGRMSVRDIITVTGLGFRVVNNGWAPLSNMLWDIFRVAKQVFQGIRGSTPSAERFHMSMLQLQYGMPVECVKFFLSCSPTLKKNGREFIIQQWRSSQTASASSATSGTSVPIGLRPRDVSTSAVVELRSRMLWADCRQNNVTSEQQIQDLYIENTGESSSASPAKPKGNTQKSSSNTGSSSSHAANATASGSVKSSIPKPETGSLKRPGPSTSLQNSKKPKSWVP
eukprot:ANDGO_01878.mRNA.1 ATP-dependent DNA helicase Hel308